MLNTRKRRNRANESIHIGSDRESFRTPITRPAGLVCAPAGEESAGKRRSGRTRKGDRYLRRMLIQNAWSVSHNRAPFFMPREPRNVRRVKSVSFETLIFQRTNSCNFVP